MIVIKFCTGVDVPDIITHAKFSGHRFRGSIDFYWLSLSSLKNLALPCRHVIAWLQIIGQIYVFDRLGTFLTHLLMVNR